MLKFINHIILSILILLLSACSSDNQYCIDPDDFFFDSFNVPAAFNGSQIEGEGEQQVTPWTETGLKTNGKPILIVVKPWELLGSGDDTSNSKQYLSAWTSWYGSSNPNELTGFTSGLPTCRVEGDQWCTGHDDLQVINAPCLFKNGKGLYGLLNKHGEADPNDNSFYKMQPRGVTFHVGKHNINHGGVKHKTINSQSQVVDAYGIYYNYDYGFDNTTQSSAINKDDYINSYLYFKISDIYYTDNDGKYQIIIKSGVKSQNLGPFSALVQFVKMRLFGVGYAITSESDETTSIGKAGEELSRTQEFSNNGIVASIFQNIIENNNFRMNIRIILTIYVAFTGLLFLAGMLQITKSELVVRVLKIAIMNQLITVDSSWSFFYNNLFIYFVQGVDLITTVMTSNITGTYSGIEIFDEMFELAFSKKLIYRLIGLMDKDFWGGAVFTLALYFLIASLIVIMAKAIVLYLLAFIFLGLLIILAPVFLTFMLFGFTKQFFDNWLKYLFSYTIQPIILIIGLSLIVTLIINEVYLTLGYGVCPKLYSFIDELIDNKPSSIWDFIANYTISTDGLSDIQSNLANIYVPNSFTKVDGTFCKPFECIDTRLPNFPYHNLNDARQMEVLTNFSNGNWVQWQSFWFFLVMVIFLDKFNSFIVSLGRYLTQSQNSGVNLAAAASEAYGNFKAVVKEGANLASKTARGLAKRTRIGRAAINKANKIKDNFKNKVDNVKTGIKTLGGMATGAAMYAGNAVGDAANKAGNKFANQAVKSVFTEKYGVKYSDISKSAASKYDSLASKHGITKNSDARSLFGKMAANKISYDQLNSAGKAKIDEMITSSKTGEIKDVNQARGSMMAKLFSGKDALDNLDKMAFTAEGNDASSGASKAEMSKLKERFTKSMLEDLGMSKKTGLEDVSNRISDMKNHSENLAKYKDIEAKFEKHGVSKTAGLSGARLEKKASKMKFLKRFGTEKILDSNQLFKQEQDLINDINGTYKSDAQIVDEKLVKLSRAAKNIANATENVSKKITESKAVKAVSESKLGKALKNKKVQRAIKLGFGGPAALLSETKLYKDLKNTIKSEGKELFNEFKKELDFESQARSKSSSEPDFDTSESLHHHDMSDDRDTGRARQEAEGVEVEPVNKSLTEDVDDYSDSLNEMFDEHADRELSSTLSEDDPNFVDGRTVYGQYVRDSDQNKSRGVGDAFESEDDVDYNPYENLGGQAGFEQGDAESEKDKEPTKKMRRGRGFKKPKN